MKTNTAQQNIPNGWQERKLGDVCDIVNGSTPKRSVSEYWENGSIPWFTVDDIRSNGRIINKTNQSITDKALKETSVKLLPEDSVLLCCTASLGEVALTKIPLTTNQQFNGLVSKNKANLFPYYLFYSAQKLGEGLKSKSGKTTINFLSVGSLSKEKVLVPPIKEQKKIAEILGTVDEDIAKTQEVIEATEKLKRGLMQQLFTRGIGHTKFKETKIGQIPEGWRVASLQTMLDKGLITSHLDGNHGELYPKSSEFINEGVPYLSANCIEDGHVNFAKAKFLSPDRASKFLKGVAINGDILFAHNATVGPVAILNMEEKYVILSTTLTYYRCNSSKLVPSYLRYFMESPLFSNQYGRVMAQTTRNQVPITIQRTFFHALPAYKEQEEIAEILSAVDEKISVNKKLKEKLTLFKKGLMQDLLSGKVRVKV